MSELRDLESKYHKLVCGQDVDFDEKDLNRLYELRQEQAEIRRTIIAEAKNEHFSSQQRGMHRISAALSK